MLCVLAGRRDGHYHGRESSRGHQTVLQHHRQLALRLVVVWGEVGDGAKSSIHTVSYHKKMNCSNMTCYIYLTHWGISAWSVCVSVCPSSTNLPVECTLPLLPSGVQAWLQRQQGRVNLCALLLPLFGMVHRVHAVFRPCVIPKRGGTQTRHVRTETSCRPM